MTVTTFAAIDIGSYEVCMKIFELSRKNGFRELNHVRYRLEIGKGAYSSGRLEQGMVDAICERLKDFRNMMLEFGVTEYRACSTSAFREMVNPVIILEQIYQRTGIRVEILSNAEQHFLGYKSIAAIESGFKKIIQKGTAILDVGGGGLQVSLFDKYTLVTTQSLKMGSMKDRDIKNVILMGDFLTDTIFREEIYDHIITMSEFTARYEDTVYKTDQMLAAEMDIDPEYASLVVPTMVICKSFLDVFQAEAVWVPGVSLLDGIAYDFCEKKKYIKSAHNFENDILVASRNIAKRYSSSKNHIQGTTKLALTIFDSMKKVHGMGARERLLLQIAVQLHDCGKYISMADVAECSYRIIMATEIIGLSTEERQVIASAVRYNTTEFVYYENFDDGAGMDRNRYLLVAKLTAILRLANAMDRSHYQKVEGLRAVLKDRELHLIIDSSRDISLELGLLKDKVEFFEEVFGIHLILRRKRRV